MPNRSLITCPRCDHKFDPGPDEDTAAEAARAACEALGHSIVVRRLSGFEPQPGCLTCNIWFSKPRCTQK